MNFLEILFDHHVWANLRVVTACQPLSELQLQHHDRGTYGSIRATLVHLARSDERYLEHFTGEESAREPMDENTQLTLLAERLKRSGEGLRSYAIKNQPDDKVHVGPPDKPELIPAAVVLLQAIYHAGEHRTHVNTLLGQIGIIPPPISGWDFYDEVVLPAKKD